MTLRAVAAAVLVIACGKHDAPAPTRDWRVVGFASDPEHPAALLAADRELAVVERDGRVRWKLTLGDEAEAHSADAVGDLILVTSGSRLRALDARDGHERWSRTLTRAITHLWRGKKSLAFATAGDIGVLELATGATRWSNVADADRVLFGQGRFVFANYSLLWIVDDETGHLLWERRIAPYVDVDWGFSNIGAVYFRGTSLVVLPAPGPPAVDLDCTGCCESCGRSPSTRELDLASGEEVPRSDTAAPHALPALELGRTWDGTHYHVERSSGPPSIVACDVLGRTLWGVPAFAATSGRALLDSSGRVVIDLLGAEHHLFFIDVASGAHATSPPLGPAERFMDVAGTCAMVLGTGEATCIDITTGGRRWTAPLAGESIDMWALENRDVLLADSDPLALSRLDPTGRRLWRTTVGGIAATNLYSDFVDHENEFFIADDPAHHTTRWQSDRMAVIVTDGRVRALDLATGAISSPSL